MWRHSINTGFRKCRIPLACAIVLAAAFANAQSNPAPEVRFETLFQSGQGGYHTYRIPALLVTAKGTILAFCEGRKDGQGDSGDIDLLLRRSFDHGATWEPVQTVADDKDMTCGNPCPILDRATGRIVLLITKNNGNEAEYQIMRGNAAPRTAWMSVSDDDGATWSAPVNISDQACPPGSRWYATGPCHGLQLKDGRLIAPCDHATGPAPEDMHSHVIFSDDGGAHWTLGGILDGRTDESTIAERTDGSLYINMRTNRGTHQRAFAISTDRGTTFSPTQNDATLVEPQCQGSVLRIDTETKPQFLFSNPASTRRENMSIRVSGDECATWSAAKTLWAGPAAYSDLAVTAQGAICCLFERGEKDPYETITLAVVPLAWLP